MSEEKTVIDINRIQEMIPPLSDPVGGPLLN